MVEFKKDFPSKYPITEHLANFCFHPYYGFFLEYFDLDDGSLAYEFDEISSHVLRDFSFMLIPVKYELPGLIGAKFYKTLDESFLFPFFV